MPPVPGLQPSALFGIHPDELAVFCRVFRRLRGMQQRAMAKAVGISASSLCRSGEGREYSLSCVLRRAGHVAGKTGAAQVTPCPLPSSLPAIWAVVGSREYADLDAVRDFVRGLPKGSTLVSGGARGVDEAAEIEARRQGFTVISHRVVKVNGVWRIGKLTQVRYAESWVPSPLTFVSFGHAAYFRNELIVEDAMYVKAFWDGKSRGTKNTMNIAQRAGKLVED